MNSDEFGAWLLSLSTPERIRALARIYSWLTVGTRQVFLPDIPQAKGPVVIKMLHGVNELHHTVASSLLAYVTDESKAFPAEVFSRQLFDIANQYGITSWLVQAVNLAYERGASTNPRP